jgi:hypothetical protein
MPASGDDDQDMPAFPANHSADAEPGPIHLVPITAQNEEAFPINRGRVTGALTSIVSPDDPIEGDRRQYGRCKLSIPAYIMGCDPDGSVWQEVTDTIEVSAVGVSGRLGRRVPRGLVVQLTLALPQELRKTQQVSPLYFLYAMVQRVEPAEQGRRVRGLEFIGEQPPPGYLETPWTIYRPVWKGPDRRLEPRQQRAEFVIIEYFDELMRLVQQRAGVTEDMSRGGSRIYTERVPDEFEWVRVQFLDQGFKSYAAVRSRYTGEDGGERLCLQFLDTKLSSE